MIPIDVATDGDYYIPGTKVNSHCYVPDCITKVINGQGIVEIHNLGIEDTYANLRLPLKAYSLNAYDTFQGKFKNNYVYPDVHQIESLSRFEHLNAEEKSSLLKICKEYYTVFQYPDQPSLSTTTQTQHDPNN